MSRSHSFVASSALVLSLAGSAFAQTQPARPATEPAAPAAAAPAAPATPTPTTPAAPIGPTKPDMSKVTENLDAKLEAMQGTPNGLTADEVARRTLLSNPDVTAKQKAVAAADATRDETKARFYPKLDLSARYTRVSDLSTTYLPLPGSPTPIPSTSLFPVILDNYTLQATLAIPLS